MKTGVGKIGLVLGFILFLAGDTQANPEVAYAVPAGNIEVDGDLNDWPDLVYWYPITEFLEGSLLWDFAGIGQLNAKGDYKGRFAVAFDSTAQLILVAVEVEDESDVFEKNNLGLAVTGAEDWNLWDGCEVYLDLTHGKQPGRVEQHAFWGGKRKLVAKEKEPQIARSRHEQLTTYEWAFDASTPGKEQVVFPGEAVGFDISISDRDEDGSFSWISWTPGTTKMVSAERVGSLRFLREGNLAHLEVQIGLENMDGTPIKDLSPYKRLIWVQIQKNGEEDTRDLADSTGALVFYLPPDSYAVRAWCPGVRDTVTTDSLIIEERGRQQVDLVLRDRGEVFYVDDDADSTGKGTKEDPVGLLSMAGKFSGPGDTIFVAEGKYAEAVTPSWGIHLIGAGAEKTLLEGEDAGIFIRGAREGAIRGVGIRNGKGIYLLDCRNFVVEENIVSGNRKNVGGGILVNGGGNVIVRRNLIARNQADFGGGVFAYGKATVEIRDNLIVANVAQEKGLQERSLNDGMGGGVVARMNPTIRNNTIAFNRAGRGGGGVVVYHLSVLEEDKARAEIVNNIVVHNENGGILAWYLGDPDIHHNNVWNNSGWNYFGIERGGKSLEEDPKFLDPLAGDFRLEKGAKTRKKGDRPERYMGAFGEEMPWSANPADMMPADSLRSMAEEQAYGPVDAVRYHTMGRIQGVVDNAQFPREYAVLDSISGKKFNRDLTIYTTRDGLASDIVLGIKQAEDGTLWFATNQGISRFDGTWRSFTVEDGLAAPLIQDLCIDRQQRIWCATQEGLSAYDGIGWKTYLKGRNVTSIGEDSKGNLWGTMQRQEIFRYDGESWDFSFFPAMPPTIGLIDAQDYLWLRSLPLGLIRFDGKEGHHFSAFPEGDVMPIGIGPARDGGFWYTHLYVRPEKGEFSSQISRFDGTSWYNLQLPTSLQGYMALQPVEDLRGGVWVTAMRGLLFFDGQEWQRIVDWDTLPPCLGMLIAADGTLWIGTNGGGVVRVGKSSWAGAGPVAGQRITGLHMDAQGNLWRATDDGLRILSPDGQEKVLRQVDGLLADPISHMSPDGEGGVWLGGTNGLSYYHPQRGWRTFAAGKEIPEGPVQALITGRDGKVWVGTPMGIGENRQSEWQLLGEKEGIDTPHILSLWEDADGTLWIGTNGGVFRKKEGQIFNLFKTLYPEISFDLYALGAEENPERLDEWMKENLPNPSIFFWFAIKLDEIVFKKPDVGSRLLEAFQRWLVSDEKAMDRLKQIAKVQSSFMERLESGPDSTHIFEIAAFLNVGNRPVSSIFRDGEDRLWFGTDRGLFAYKDSAWSLHDTQTGLPSNRVEKIQQDRKGNLWALGPEGASRYDGTEWVVFNEEDGLPDRHVLSLVEDEEGALLFGTARGLSRRTPDTTPPNTDIVDGPEGIHAEPQVLFRFVGGDPETGQRALTFSHAFTAQGKQPVVEEWSPYMSETFFQEAFLDGKYTFHVRARDKEGNVDPTPSRQDFQIRTESLVQIAQVDIDPIFPAIYRWYADHRLGSVKLANKGKAPLKAILRLHIPEYMDVPTEQEVVLVPESVTEVDLHALFADRIAEVSKGKQTTIYVELLYQKEGQSKKVKQSSMGRVESNNALTWKDPRMAAAFITSVDEQVSEFARGTLQQQRGILSKGTDRYLSRAMVLFDALGVTGLRYVKDANTPYGEVAASGMAVDNIQYPAQFLGSKSGDCDDCTVLYCALLENIGISTALVDAPGHIFMMFDAGVSVDALERLCLQENQYVIYQDRVWIPVEVTLLGESFSEAWRLGAEATSYLTRTGPLKVYSVGEAWEEYQPGNRSFSVEASVPDSSLLSSMVYPDLDELVIQRETYLQRHFLSPLRRNPSDHALRSKLARMYVYLDRFEEAQVEYRRLISAGYELAATHNDLGIALVVGGDYTGALTSFEEAVRLAPEEEGYRLNYEFAMGRLESVEVVSQVESVSDKTKGSIPFLADRFHWATK